MDLDSWFEDREIQEFVEKLEKKSIKTAIKSNFKNEQLRQESSINITENIDNALMNVDERKLPWPGGH